MQQVRHRGAASSFVGSFPAGQSGSDDKNSLVWVSKLRNIFNDDKSLFRKYHASYENERVIVQNLSHHKDSRV